MRATGVRLTNITCFEDLSLDFTDAETGEAAPWVVILGENGTGKSTLLQMMAVTSLNYFQLAAIAGDIEREGLIRGEALSGICTVNFQLEKTDVNYTANAHSFPITFSYGQRREPRLGSRGKPVTYDELQSVPDNTKEKFFAPSLTGGWFACGYGSARRLKGQAISDRGGLPLLEDSAKPYRFASLFGDAVGMTNVPDWIAGLYFSANHPDGTEVDSNRYEKAQTAILRVLPHLSSLEVTKDRQVMVTEGDTRVPLERLSDGYRGTLSWIGDLIRRLFDAYPDSEDPLKERGVVLVDEIDLHLHPKWQRSVVEDVRKLFPNLQFIVTSHSPFVAQDMRPGDKIIVLERSGRDGKGPVIAREENGGLESWSADQILSSYFGLRNGTRGEKTQKAEARFVRLLEVEAAGNLTEAQRKELDKLRLTVDRIPIGETPDEQAFYRAADNAVALLRERRRALEAAQHNGHGDTST